MTTFLFTRSEILSRSVRVHSLGEVSMHQFKPNDVHERQTAGVPALPSDQLSDEHLLSAMASGAIWAMEALYQRYSRIFYALAYRMVANPQVAEDLIQEAFFAIWQQAAIYTPHAGAAKSWLSAIVRHRIIDYMRATHRRSVLQEATQWEADNDESYIVPDVWPEVLLLLQGTQVRDALQRLPQEQREVIELAYFQGWTHMEIAQARQIPLGTVKGRMRLGLKHLHHLLIQMGIDEL